MLAFQESGVKAEDGILQFIQANATPSTDRDLLPTVIADEVNKRKDTWDPRWRNELVLERDPAQYSHTRLQDGRWCRFYSRRRAQPTPPQDGEKLLRVP